MEESLHSTGFIVKWCILFLSDDINYQFIIMLFLTPFWKDSPQQRYKTTITNIKFYLWNSVELDCKTGNIFPFAGRKNNIYYIWTGAVCTFI